MKYSCYDRKALYIYREYKKKGIDMLRVLRNIIKKKPILVVYDVTKLCNERCPMCNVWKQKSNDMTLDQINKMAKRLRKFGIGYVFIQGGEPTLRSDLVDIIDVFLCHEIKPTVITNGILMDKELATEIAKRKCNLAISLDVLDAEKYKKYRGQDAYEQVMDNIKAIAPIKRKGNWTLTTTVSKLTSLDEVIALEQLAEGLGFMYAIRPYVFVNGTAGKKNNDLIYEYDDVEAIFSYMLGRARKNNYFASLIYEEHIKYIKGETMPKCDAMTYSIVMQEDGKFAPCIEFTGRGIDIATFKEDKKKYKEIICTCNDKTPCFYNCVREIGILIRRKWRILFNVFKIVRQMITYGNFF